jgi:hypothetical protein
MAPSTAASVSLYLKAVRLKVNVDSFARQQINEGGQLSWGIANPSVLSNPARGQANNGHQPK